MLRPICLLFFSSFLDLVCFSPRVFCRLFSSSLYVLYVCDPPLPLFALFSTAVPSAECLRCALWLCSVCISDSGVRAFHNFCLLRSFPKLREHKYANTLIFNNSVPHKDFAKKAFNPFLSTTYPWQNSYYAKLIWPSQNCPLPVNPSYFAPPTLKKHLWLDTQCASCEARCFLSSPDCLTTDTNRQWQPHILYMS